MGHDVTYNAEARQDEYINFRVTKKSEEVLIKHWVAAALVIEKTS